MSKPYFYSVAHMQGTGLACELLDTGDPYGLEPAEIVERLLALGHTPVLYSEQRKPFPQYGRTTEVQRDGSTFLVAVSRDAELIGVQEVRADRYEDE